MLLSSPDCREHAELAEPTLRDDGEARRGNERGKEQEDGGDGEQCERVCGLDLAAVPNSREARTAVPFEVCEGVELLFARVDQNGDVLRRPADEGETKANSSLRSSGFSTIPTTCAATRRDRASPPAPRLGARPPLGEGDLAGAGRVAATAEREEIAAVRPIRVLRARDSTVSTPPGTGTLRWPMTSIVPNDSSADARAASSVCGSEPSNLSSPLAEPNSPSNSGLVL